MNSDKKRSSPLMVGASSLLVIFAVLCLTVFALLSVSTVQAHQRLSEKSASSIEEYYAADSAAEEILAMLRAGEIPEGVKEENGVYTYVCLISETQALAVKVKVSGADYTILRWQAISTADWKADDTLPVWNEE